MWATLLRGVSCYKYLIGPRLLSTQIQRALHFYATYPTLDFNLYTSICASAFLVTWLSAEQHTVVPPVGLEPTANNLTGCRSTN